MRCQVGFILLVIVGTLALGLTGCAGRGKLVTCTTDAHCAEIFGGNY